MKFLSKHPWLIVAMAIYFLFTFNKALAADAVVLVGSGGLKFVPALTNIAVNDHVIWSWASVNHSTTSGTNGLPSGLWDSGVASGPHSFTNTFATSGTFLYYCSVHASFGMTGAVVVASANLPPTNSITSPTNGAVFSAPANVTIHVSAGDSDGSITNVQFRIGATILTNETTIPFSATTNNLPAGNYTLTAIASDNLGATATNSVSISIVTPVTITLASAAKFSNTGFQFNYAANVGLRYSVERSTNLIDWIVLATNTADSNPVVFTDAQATNNPDFYRVRLMPNP